jgi:hypothetical protein
MCSQGPRLSRRLITDVEITVSAPFHKLCFANTALMALSKHLETRTRGRVCASLFLLESSMRYGRQIGKSTIPGLNEGPRTRVDRFRVMSIRKQANTTATMMRKQLPVSLEETPTGNDINAAGMSQLP